MSQRELTTCLRVLCVFTLKQVLVRPLFEEENCFDDILVLGKVCVPIDIDMVDTFDPFNVPTVSKICCEFEEHGSSSAENRGVCIYTM